MNENNGERIAHLEAEWERLLNYWETTGYPDTQTETAREIFEYKLGDVESKIQDFLDIRLRLDQIELLVNIAVDNHIESTPLEQLLVRVSEIVTDNVEQLSPERFTYELAETLEKYPKGHLPPEEQKKIRDATEEIEKLMESHNREMREAGLRAEVWNQLLDTWREQGVSANFETEEAREAFIHETRGISERPQNLNALQNELESIELLVEIARVNDEIPTEALETFSRIVHNIARDVVARGLDGIDLSQGRTLNRILYLATHIQMPDEDSYIQRAKDATDTWLDSFEEEEYNWPEDEDDYNRSLGESFGFSPNTCRVETGEEFNYNHENPENMRYYPELYMYNVFQDSDGSVYFKSAGLFANLRPGWEAAQIDFTPDGIAWAGGIEPERAMVKAYMAMKNLLYAMREGDIQQIEGLYGYTNPTMARFATRFGFKIIYKGEEFDYSSVKKSAIPLTEGQTYEVKASVEEVQEKIKAFEEKGLAKRLLQNYTRGPSTE